MERLSDLQQSIFFLPSESHDKLLSGNCLTVQRLGVASQQEEESGLMVTPSALARNDSMIPRSRSTLNLVDSSPAVQLGPQSAELRHPGATQMGSAAESCVTWWGGTAIGRHVCFSVGAHKLPELICNSLNHAGSSVVSAACQLRQAAWPNSFAYTARPPPTTRLLFHQPQELRCVFVMLQGRRAPEQEIHVLLLKFRSLILLSLSWKRRLMYVDPGAPKLLKQERAGDYGWVALAWGPTAVKQMGYHCVL